MWIIINSDGSYEYPLGETHKDEGRDERPMVGQLPELQIVPVTPELPERGEYVPYPHRVPPPLRRNYDN